jgi:hypothetical protein
MYKLPQRFIALLLLFSITLQSCYTPLKMSNKKRTFASKVYFKSGKDFHLNTDTPLEKVQSEIDWVEGQEEQEQSDCQENIKDLLGDYNGEQILPLTVCGNIQGATFTTSEGNQLKNFCSTSEGCKAIVVEKESMFYRQRELKVVFLEVYSVQDLVARKNDAPWQRQHIHIKTTPEGKAIVCIGKYGLKGGGNGSGKEKRRSGSTNPTGNGAETGGCIYPKEAFTNGICPSGKHKLLKLDPDNSAIPSSPPAVQSAPYYSSNSSRGCSSIDDTKNIVSLYFDKMQNIQSKFGDPVYIRSSLEASRIKSGLESYIDDIKELGTEANYLLNSSDVNFSSKARIEFSELHENFLSDLNRLYQDAKKAEKDLKSAENLQLQINLYQQTIKEIHEKFGNGVSITKVEQARIVKYEVNDYITKLECYFSNIRSNVIFSVTSGSEFIDIHKEHIRELKRFRDFVDDALKHINRSNSMIAKVESYQYIADNIQYEFGEGKSITSVEQVQKMEYALREHIFSLQCLWSDMRNIGFSSDDIEEKARQSHLAYIDSLEILYTELSAIEQSIIKRDRLKAQLELYQERMQIINKELGSEVLIENVEQAQQIKLNVQAHIAYLLELWVVIESIDSPEENLYQIHKNYLNDLSKITRDLDEIEAKIKHDKLIQVKVELYQQRMEEVKKEIGETISISSIDHAKQMKLNLQAHIAYVDIWKDIEHITKNAPEDRLFEFHKKNLSILQDLYDYAQVTEKTMEHKAKLGKETDLYTERIELVLSEFNDELRVTSPEHAKQLKEQLQGHIDYLLGIWKNIEVITAGAPGENLCKFHEHNLGIVQQIYGDIAEIEDSMVKDLIIKKEIDRYQERMQIVEEQVNSGISITSLEQVQQVKNQVKEHIDYLLGIWKNIEVITAGAPEENLCKFHEHNLGIVQGVYEDVTEMEVSMAKNTSVKSEIDRYQERMQVVQEQFNSGLRVTSVEQVQQLKKQLQGHIDYLLGIWKNIEVITAGAPEENLCKFHEHNLGMVQGIYKDISEMEISMVKNISIKSEIDRYQERMQVVQEQFNSGLRFTSLEQVQQMKDQLKEHIDYLLKIWKNIEVFTAGAPEENLCKFHEHNLGMVQGIYKDISEMERSMAKEHSLQSEIDRYQQRMQLVLANFNSGLHVTSPEDAHELKSQLNGHIRYLLEIWKNIEDITSGSPEEDLRKFHEHNLGIVQEIYEDIAKIAQSIKPEEKKELSSVSTKNQLKKLALPNNVEEAKQLIESVATQVQDLVENYKEQGSTRALQRSAKKLIANLLTLLKNAKKLYLSSEDHATDPDNSPELDKAIAADIATFYQTITGLEEELLKLRELSAQLEKEAKRPKVEDLSLDNLEASQQSVEQYLEAWQKANPQERTDLKSQGLALLKSIEKLKKETKSSYRTYKSLFLDNDLAESNQTKVFEEVMPKSKDDLNQLRDLRKRLLSNISPDEDSVEACGLKTEYSEEKQAYEHCSSDEEALYTTAALKNTQAFIKGAVYETINSTVSISASLLNLPSLIPNIVGLVVNLPNITEVLYEYVSEFPDLSDEEVSERIGRMIGLAITEILSRRLPDLPITKVKKMATKVAIQATKETIKRVGQKHHIISNKILKAINEHAILAGKINRNDPRLLVIAKDLASHIGYQFWHMKYDKLVVDWLKVNKDATLAQFFKFLHNEHQQDYLKDRFIAVDLTYFFKNKS